MIKPIYSLFMFALFLFSTVTIAETEEEKITPEAPQSEVVDQLRLLIDLSADYKASIKELDQQLARTKQKSDVERLLEEKKKVQEKLEKQQRSIEQIATGAVDLSLFEQPKTESFSLQDEIKEVVKPILTELKKITEGPRQIEELRGELESLSKKLEAARLATDEIEKLKSAVESKQIKETLQVVLEKWQSLRDELESSTKLVEFQLNEKTAKDVSTSTAVIEAVKKFFTGRGLNLLLAILVFIATFVFFRYLSHVLERVISKGQDKERRFFARLVHIAFQVLTVVMSLVALMLTLYIMGDWLLLSLLIILAIGFAFALRHSLPKYVDEARLLLNMGPVREGERVVYQGIPWRVSRLNMKSDLVNPLLTGGHLRLPMSDMLNLISRDWSRSEPWFPSKPNDCVLLADNTFGKVILQTPEMVQIKVRGGAVRTYPTSDFLSATPYNLSEGFGLFVSFGLDY